MSITTLVVSYTAADENLWLALRPKLEQGLAAHPNPLMKQLKVWTFRNLRGGQNDHDQIQRMFQSPDSAGLLCVSVAACGREYIRQNEWPLFRAASGAILKPFVAAMLGPIDFAQVDLGVLGRVGGNATQLLHVVEDGKVWSWQDCLGVQRRHGDDSLCNQYVSKLVADLAAQLFP